MTQSEWEITEDEYGVYWKMTNEFGIEVTLVEYKQKWKDENPPIESDPQPPTLEEKLEALEQEKLYLQLALAESIEKQEIDKVNNQLALAELVETLIMKGVL